MGETASVAKTHREGQALINSLSCLHSESGARVSELLFALRDTSQSLVLETGCVFNFLMILFNVN